MFILTITIGGKTTSNHYYTFKEGIIAAQAASMIFLLLYNRHPSIKGPIVNGKYYSDLFNEGSIILNEDPDFTQDLVKVGDL